MKTIKVTATNELLEMLFCTGNIINAKVLKGLPEDAKLVDAQVDHRRNEAVMFFHTNNDAADNVITVSWQKDNRMACIKEAINRQTLKELMVTPMALIQEISDIVDDERPNEAGM